MTPPALTVAVGGTSRLQLLLRQDYYTVQNLTRVGDDWSFTRPLDSGSTLPLCAHLGDLTIRLRPSHPTAAQRDASASSALWSLFSTISLGASAMPLPLPARTAGGEELLAAQDVTKTLAASASGTPFPMRVVRTYSRSVDGSALLVRFNLTSTSDEPLEIGGL